MTQDRFKTRVSIYVLLLKGGSIYIKDAIEKVLNGIKFYEYGWKEGEN